MTDDNTFRTILIAAFVVLIPIGLYHRVKSQATGEKLDRRQEGLFILVSLRLLGLAGAVGFITYLVSPATMTWAAVPVPEWMRWIGVALGSLGCVLFVWTFRSLGKNITDTVVTRKDHSLVTTGPYVWVRHPFYCSGALAILGASLTAANWFLLVTGSLALTLLVIRTRVEEDHLIARFGDDYRNYMSRTGRFIPKFTSPAV
jgi:protein-S-isoprenylcysteine O-methyltransferase Ste14